MTAAKATARALKAAEPLEDDADLFDLDALEHEATVKPMRFRLGGETFVFAAPEDADWHVKDRDAESMSLADVLRGMLGDGQFERFEKLELPVWKMNALLERYATHYGTTPPESDASVAS